MTDEMKSLQLHQEGGAQGLEVKKFIKRERQPASELYWLYKEGRYLLDKNTHQSHGDKTIQRHNTKHNWVETRVDFDNAQQAACVLNG